MKKIRLSRSLAAFWVALLTSPLALADTVRLPSVGNEYIDAAITMLQPYINAVTGPYALLFTGLGIVLGATAWYLAPKEGFVGMALKIVGLGVVILNVPALVYSLQF